MTEEEKKKEAEEDAKDGKLKPNEHNGGNHDSYHWEQTLSELTVYYYLPDGCTSKDLKIDMGVNKFKMTIKGEVAIDAPWGGGKMSKIKVDESLWTIERNNDAVGKAVLQICLTKHKADEWWHSVW